jgi:hypothetical protein
MRCAVRWWLCFACVFLVGSSFAEADGELDKANAQYREAQKKQTEGINATFERKLKELARDGDLQAIEEVQAEQKEFKRSGRLPESTVMKSAKERYDKSIETAKKKLQLAYEQKVKAETRAGRIEEARAIQDQLDVLIQSNFHLKQPIPPGAVDPAPTPIDDPNHGFGFGYDQLPRRVRVLPIGFVPSGQKLPTAEETSLFLRHLAWTQTRYAELLNGDTFEFADAPPQLKIIRGRRPLDEYRQGPNRGADIIVAQILSDLNLNRFENPYCFAILLMNSVDSFPEGGGRTINGGVNAGGGMFYISSWELSRNTHIQCTLQHEIGHSFGLPHVSVYGYDQNNNPSLMSYNPAHHNQGFVPSPTPGVFIPEDLRVLALNNRVFLKTSFDEQRNVPQRDTLFPYVVPLGPMELPGHPNFYPTATTNAGEDLGSKAERCLYGYIRPSVRFGGGLGVNYDPGNMWHTNHNLTMAKATLNITFPFPVEIDGIGIHTQHSAMDHHATHATLAAADAEPVVPLLDTPLTKFDAEVNFPKTQSRKWRLELTPGPSKTVVVRGIRFLNRGREIYPRMAPYGPLKSIP